MESSWRDDTALANAWCSNDGLHVVIGVDGGGTSTTAVVLGIETFKRQGALGDSWVKASEIEILGRGCAGSSNVNSVGEVRARGALEESMAAALRAAKLPRAAVRAVCLGMAGIDTPADAVPVRGWMRTVFPSGEVEIAVHNDSVAALASGTGGQLRGAAVLISGTGCIAFGVSKEGQTARAAGAGPVLGDRGSGYAIAVEALGAVMRAEDGRGPRTALRDAILLHLGLSEPQDLISWAYRDLEWARVAALVPLVKRCAASEDAEAVRILQEAAEDLARSVAAVAATLQLASSDGQEEFPVVLVGGVLECREGEWDVEAAVRHSMMQLLPSAQPRRPLILVRQLPYMYRDHRRRIVAPDENGASCH
eukprot:TRINITY_DN26678_c0_g1_i1.p1 TRINITY_DN26678_c0_g1~~TRINITY_DN26678_c0_g1_i1.p1  ORF type:complete len:366 (+),score=39.95 TRINITY_DN26678_c0_g1_i1:222-1319(+)